MDKSDVRGKNLRLILARHGETLWNRDRKIQGITDIGLSDLGMEQAKKLALSLQNEKLDAIITSPLERAYETARIIGTYHDLSIAVENDLQELDVGKLGGMTFTELMVMYPEFLGQWMLDNASVVMPHGESLMELQERVWPVIQRICKNAENALIVSHNFVIITILCKIQNFSLSHTTKIRVSLASKTHIDFKNGTGNIVLFNDTAHLHDCS